ncbi:type II toxin-antitoxin system PemK/MazF family toxin [Streptomyces sp. NPDC015032]|uniref:type II toxin-antitoxin system PemK/MazF family toxin n=1 Tax=Streptomyces sp. NPDC015032 TaxID=3364937 RepID=UPI0036FE726A
MDMSWWWIALAVVVLLALVAAVADGRGRGGRSGRPTGRRSGGRPGGRPGGRTRPPAGPGRGPEPERRPRPGEIWWAEVPYEDGPGTKDRPCLVLSVRGDAALVVKITSKRHEERPGVIALPAGTVGDARERASFLETDELREVAVRGFRRRVGLVDAEVWERVRKLR